MMLSCRKATELIEKKAHFRLNILEKIQLRLHTSMCQACHHYENQDQQINSLLKEELGSVDKQEKVAQQKMPEDLKLKILENIQKKN